MLEREIALDWDDFVWLIVRTLRILGKSNDPLPPQGIYNAGQKLFALMVYAMIPIVMLTGVVMAFHLGGTTLVAWAVVLHFVAVGMVFSGLMIHVYMGAVFPEEKPAFFSMITGTVNELYAYRHHFKWWKEVKMQEREWKQEIEGSGGKVGPDGGNAAATATGDQGEHGLNAARSYRVASFSGFSVNRNTGRRTWRASGWGSPC